jgi:hypothetical protein
VRRLQGVLGQALKFCGRSKSRNQLLVQEPGGRTLNSIFAIYHLSLGDEFCGAAILKRSVQSCEVNVRATCVAVNHGYIFQVLTKNEVRFEELSVQLSETAWLISSNPLGNSQCLPRFREARRPVQWQSSLSGLTLQRCVHQPNARSRGNTAGRNVWMGLECQIIEMKSVANENCVSLLSDIAERAKEVFFRSVCSGEARREAVPTNAKIEMLSRRNQFSF